MTARISVVGLIVADMNASVEFYRLLGLDPQVQGPHAEAELPGGLRLTWDTEDLIVALDPAWTRPSGGARTSLGFDCGTAEEVDRVYAEVVAAGGHGHLPPWDAVWRQRYAVLHDPDGNSVDLFAWLAGAPGGPPPGV